MHQLDLSKATSYHEGSFPPTEINYDHLVHPLLKATAALARYDQELRSLHNPEFFLAPLRSQEAVLSSRMEGTISTVDEILEYDAAEEEGNDQVHTRSDVLETILYRRTLHYAQAEINDGRPIGSSLIKSMHQLLLSYGRGASKSPGQYKQEQNYIGEKSSRMISYVPISPEKLEEGMERVFSYINSSAHPEIIRTGVAHLEFEALPPFKDGNGRIGRMLITLMLWSSGVISSPHFYISRYMEEHKREYIERMRQVSNNNDWNGWILFFLSAVEEQADYNLDLTQQIKQLYETMKQVFSESTGSKHAINMLDCVFTNPIFSFNQISKKSGISNASVNRFIKSLQTNNKELIRVVREPAGRRAALYGFNPLLEIIRV